MDGWHLGGKVGSMRLGRPKERKRAREEEGKRGREEERVKGSRANSFEELVVFGGERGRGLGRPTLNKSGV
jgi:hypothetical protein